MPDTTRPAIAFLAPIGLGGGAATWLGEPVVAAFGDLIGAALVLTVWRPSLAGAWPTWRHLPARAWAGVLTVGVATATLTFAITQRALPADTWEIVAHLPWNEVTQPERAGAVLFTALPALLHELALRGMLWHLVERAWGLPAAFVLTCVASAIVAPLGDVPTTLVFLVSLAAIRAATGTVATSLVVLLVHVLSAVVVAWLPLTTPRVGLAGATFAAVLWVAGVLLARTPATDNERQ